MEGGESRMYFVEIKHPNISMFCIFLKCCGNMNSHMQRTLGIIIYAPKLQRTTYEPVT